MSRSRWTFSLSSLLLTLLWCGPLGAQPSYTVEPLGTLIAFGLASPFVVGEEAGQPVRRHLLTQVTEPLATQGQGGRAWFVRPDGTAAGSTGALIGGTVQDVATVWAPDGTPVFLLDLVPSVALQADADGVVAVFSIGGCGAGTWAARWTPAEGTVQCLGPVTRADVGVDGEGRIWGTTAGGITVWDVDGNAIIVGTGRFESLNSDTAVAAATVVSGAVSSSAVRLSEGEVTVLPNLRDLRFCEARWVSPDGTVVGGCAQSQNLIFATLWTPDNQVFDLNDLADFPPTFEQVALVIDDAGLIVVSVLPSMPLGPRRSVLLRPVERVAECGGDVTCRCGDTVVADYTLPGPLTCALTGTDAALVLASKVTLDLNGQAVLGTGGGTGILFDGVEGSAVVSGTVKGFTAGVKLRAGAAQNKGASMIAAGNATSLWMEQVPHNKVIKSKFSGDGGEAVHLIDAHKNQFLSNHFVGGVIVLENSADNTFKGNVIESEVVGQDVVAKR